MAGSWGAIALSLAKSKHERYARQMLIPEVAERGQQKLLAAAVSLYGENSSSIAVAAYYLAAAGIGCIECHVDDDDGYRRLAADLQDLNRHVRLTLAEGERCILRIVLGSPDYVAQQQARLAAAFVPTVLAVYHAWQGVQFVANDQAGLLACLAKLPEAQAKRRAHEAAAAGGTVFSRGFFGALSALQIIKLTLGIGVAAPEPLHADLAALHFANVKLAESAALFQALGAPTAAPAASSGGGNVLIVGAGGLGSPVAYALTLAGVGQLGLVDFDTVAISNLNRQFLHAESRLGMLKTASAACFLQRLAPGIPVKQYAVRLNAENVAALIADYDVVIAAVDNFSARLLLNEACVKARKPLVEGGVAWFDGALRTIIPHQGPCCRCTNPAQSNELAASTEIGVIGPAPGVIGFMQAAEAMKLLTGIGEVASDRMIFFDGLLAEFCTIKLARNPACPLCGGRAVSV